MSSLEFSRSKLLAGAGVTVAAFTLGGRADAAPEAPVSLDSGAPSVNAPPVHGLHLQFGADASTEVVVSWHTLEDVREARVLLGNLSGAYERSVAAVPVAYVDAKSGRTVRAYHAKLTGLKPGAAYLYAAIHEGAEPEFGTFRTMPRGRSRFTFTSFGDQGTPTLGKRYVPPEGVTIPNPPFVNDNLGSPFAGDTTLGVERLRPAFHLFNGDLCYANIATDRVRTW